VERIDDGLDGLEITLLNTISYVKQGEIYKRSLQVRLPFYVSPFTFKHLKLME
jgi:hypothetical protein